jgi:tryptophan halogenase
VLSTELGNTEWNSFKDYLLADSAIAFPTEADPSGEIRPYTRARAASAGWVWEIPTQARRGNGYVFSSNHITETAMIDEVSKITGYTVTPAKTFKFDPGHLKDAWVKNCCAVGLSYSFVEPIEATSIGSTIQQMLHLIPCLASYKKENQYMQVDYNRKMSRMMDNILTMVRLHYYTDKTNTQFWVDAKNMKVNDELQHLINLWSERMPSRYDVEDNNGEMFAAQHLIHVAQGQNILNLESAHLAIERFGLHLAVAQDMSDKRLQRTNHELVDHAEALRELNVW